MAIQQRNTSQAMNSDIQKQNDDQGRDTDRLLPNQSEKLILSWNEIPTWMQDNVYITGGYRRQTNSYWGCVKSLGYLHNESGMYIRLMVQGWNTKGCINSEYLEPFVDIHTICWFWNSLFVDTALSRDVDYF
ncbi:hypothetical protein G6F42_019752 [Rhizopus arrhizus]|nr:hypothetical protein G6F42_019752 [Rhizopus arrhizus]